MRKITMPARNWLPVSLAVIATLFVLTSVIAGIRHYTPVPIWDMWGALDFYTAFQEGAGWTAWWKLSNEHRIVLSRVLFLVDYSWFEGRFIFLLAVNYLLILCSVATFWAFLKARVGPLPPAQAIGALACLLIWLFSWVQYENISWPFQSQFFLAQLLPLLALYCLYRSATQPESVRWLTCACLLGSLSIGTMISGIMTLPMMALYAAVARMGWRRTTLLALLAALGIFVYFWGYSSPPGHGSVLETLQKHPLDMVQYTLQYLGGPFQHFIRRLRSELWVGQCFGVVFVALSLVKLLPALRAPKSHLLDLALLTFIAYISGIAFATSGARLVLGMESALSSRYTTPTLMAWAALAILYAPRLFTLRKYARTVAAILLLVVLALMVIVQKHGMKRNDWSHMRMMGALALTMGVNDARHIGMLVWNADYGRTLVRKGIQHKAGIFGQPALSQAAEAIGSRPNALPPQCEAFIDDVHTLPEDPHFVIISGAVRPSDGASPSSLRLIGQDGTVVGYGLTYRWRERQAPDTTKAPARYLTFSAYVKTNTDSVVPSTLTLTAPDTACSVSLSLPRAH